MANVSPILPSWLKAPEASKPPQDNAPPIARNFYVAYLCIEWPDWPYICGVRPGVVGVWTGPYGHRHEDRIGWCWLDLDFREGISIPAKRDFFYLMCY